MNHRELIDNEQALANGNDLRVYFRKDKECQPKEIDRILKNITTTKTEVFFKLQEDFSESLRDGSAYYFVYGNIYRWHTFIWIIDTIKYCNWAHFWDFIQKHMTWWLT